MRRVTADEHDEPSRDGPPRVEIPRGGSSRGEDEVGREDSADDAGLATNVGVGPWPGGRSAWPGDPRLDPELLEHGDRRNVVDRYRYWRMPAIVGDLDARRHPFAVAIENWQHDLNIGSIVRTANAFLADSVHIVGRRRWNRRGAMVTDRYQHVLHHEGIPTLVAWAQERSAAIIAVDNVAGAVDLLDAPLPERGLLLFGQEGPGLTDAALAAADRVASIRQYGSTRSLNAAAAAAIVMHEWVRVHAGRPFG
ncbi:MAG: rRNA methyltransferase [Micrococcales bacterium]|nr:rRNA methyltransferase [Micrococcales bacterium]